MVPPQDFRLVQGEEALSDYQFGTRVGHHLFCRHCGVWPFARGYIEEIGGDYVAVNVAALDTVTVEELRGAPVRYFDGHNNNWWAEPEDKAHL